MRTLRIALVHDYLLTLRGAERTFAAIAEVWPNATIHTLLFDEAAVGGAFAGRTVRTSSLQRLGVRQDTFRRFLPLYPVCVGMLDVGDVDVVVSSSSAFAHGVRKPPGARHICYCHSPFRYAWHERDSGLCAASAALRPVQSWVLDRLRTWDQRAASRVDHYIANSAITRERIRQFYGRDASIVHPPVDVERFTPAEPEDWFVVVGAVVRHKRVDLALEAARRAGVRLKVVGTGPDLPRLASESAAFADFLGWVDDATLIRLLPRARALIVPNVEEFGIAAVEAQAAGRPVVGLRAGGTGETVIDGETGVLLESQDPESFAQALGDVDFDAFSPERAVQNAARYSPERFRTKLSLDVTSLAALEPDSGSPPRRRHSRHLSSHQASTRSFVSRAFNRVTSRKRVSR
jgi:glycosyltransferase involved in cell wall biosynthesis